MILEAVTLQVVPGREEDYEAAFRRAEPLLARQQGYHRHALLRGIEDPSTYLLTVEWDGVDSHEVGFRGSDDYQEWRRLLHHFYVELPRVPHFRPVAGG